MNCNLPGSPVCGIFQARIMEWVAISFSRGSSRPRDWTWVSSIADRCFTVWATREAHMYTYIQRERGRGREEGQRDRETERVAWPVCIVWKLIPCCLLCLQIFSLILREVFHLVYSFLCCAKAFNFNYVLFVYFCFYFHFSRRWMKKHIAVIYVKECSACVFL